MFPSSLQAAEVPTATGGLDEDRDAQLLFWAEMIRAQWEDIYSDPSKTCKERMSWLISARKWFESDDFTYATSFRVVCEHLGWDYQWVRKVVFSGPPPKNPLNSISLMTKQRKDRHERNRKKAGLAPEDSSRRRSRGGRSPLSFVPL
jgi:hypothetical protein